jgi:hypothetical protein
MWQFTTRVRLGDACMVADKMFGKPGGLDLLTHF